MSQRNSDSAEASQWKKKLLDTIEYLDKREKALINRIKLLRRGLVGQPQQTSARQKPGFSAITNLAELIFDRADKALYSAKEQGRNRVCIAPAAKGTA